MHTTNATDIYRRSWQRASLVLRYFAPDWLTFYKFPLDSFVAHLLSLPILALTRLRETWSLLDSFAAAWFFRVVICLLLDFARSLLDSFAARFVRFVIRSLLDSFAAWLVCYLIRSMLDSFALESFAAWRLARVCLWLVRFEHSSRIHSWIIHSLLTPSCLTHSLLTQDKSCLMGGHKWLRPTLWLWQGHAHLLRWIYTIFCRYIVYTSHNHTMHEHEKHWTWRSCAWLSLRSFKWEYGSTCTMTCTISWTRETQVPQKSTNSRWNISNPLLFFHFGLQSMTMPRSD